MIRTGWPRRLLLIIAGAVSALALPPVHLVFLLLPAFTVLAWAVFACTRPGRAFMAGWWFGLGHCAAGFYWVGHAFLVDAERYGFLAPVAVIGLAVGMAVFPGLAGLAAHLFRRWRPAGPLGRILLLGSLWAVTEWIRSWVLTGFPWNLIGSVWTFSPAMLQGTAFLGPYGLGLVTVALASLPAVFLWGWSRRRGVIALAGGAVVGLVLWGAGEARLAGPAPGMVDGIQLRLVQPNIPQHLKWKNELRAGHVGRQLEMSLRPAAEGKSPTHVIWAETAVPYNLSGDEALRGAMARAVPAGGALVTGAPRATQSTDGSRQLFNSVHALGPDGTITATYDKKHLVPFGEYVPLRSILGLSKLTAGRLDFTPGTTPRVIRIPGLPPAAVLVCYEVIFPAEVAAFSASPAWLLNVTNDAWFGISAGPHQHLATAQMRAAEQGLPLVRVANTGISAVVDSYGRLLATLPLDTPGILDSGLPASLQQRPPYGRFGDILTWLLILGALAIAAFLPPGRESDAV